MIAAGHVTVPITAPIAPFERSISQARKISERFEQQAVRNMAGVTHGLNRASAATGKITVGMKGATAATAVLTRTVGRLTALLGPLSAGFAAMFAVRTMADFGESMAGIEAVTRATGDEIARMTALARTLGATTEFTASQAAEGMKFLGMAGFETNAILETMPAMLDLATAASLDLGRAADITSNIMTGFGLAASQAGQVADVIAATASRANTNIEQMGDAMKYVGPVAAALNKGIDETAAAIGALSDAGLQGSMAGTGLRRVYSSLANPTKEAAGVIQSLGLTLEEVNPALHSTTEIVAALASHGLSAADALTIFGDRGGPAMLALIANEPKLRSLTDALGDAGGEATRMATVMRDNLAGDFRTAQSAVEDFFLTIGNAGATSALRTAVQGVTEAVRILSDNIDTVSGVAMGAATLAMPALISGIEAATAATYGLAAAMAANPIGLLTLAVGAIIGLLVAFKDETVEIGNTTIRVGGILDAIWATVRHGVGILVEELKGLAGVTYNLVTLDFDGAMHAAGEAARGVAHHSERINEAWRSIVALPLPDFAAGLQAANEQMERMSFGVNFPKPPDLPSAGGVMTPSLLDGGAAGSAQSQLDQLRESLMSAEESEQVSYERRLAALASFRESQAVSAEEAANLLERIQAVHSSNIVDIQADAMRQEIAMRQQTIGMAVGLLDQFGAESKAAAIAAVLLNKATMIAQTIQNTAAASAAALAPPPLGLGPLAGAGLAASAQAFGALQVATIAGTGIGQIAQMKGSTAAVRAPTVPTTSSTSSEKRSTTETSSSPLTTVHVTLSGSGRYSREEVRRLIEGLNDAISDGARLVVNPD